MTMQDRNRNRRQTRIAAGLCVDCKFPTNGTTRCRGCTSANSNRRSTGRPPGRPSTRNKEPMPIHITPSTALEVFVGSDGNKTQALYTHLQGLGPAGIVATNLFRACKASGRAKTYRGKYKGLAYDKKNWSLQNLCRILEEHGEALGIRHGWKIDPAQAKHRWVLYIDLPNGQCSFHSETRHTTRDYAGEWDQQSRSDQRIVAWTQSILNRQPITA